MIVFMLLFALTMSSCSAGGDGFADIKKARDLYTGLDSAYITVTDLEAKKLICQFVFRYEGDLLTYYYMNRKGDEIYYEHHSGYKLSFGYYGDEGWTERENGSKEYYFYGRNKKHPNADREMIFFNENCVLNTEVIKTGSFKQVNCKYDVVKLGNKTAGLLPAFDEITEYTVKIVIGDGGYADTILHTGVADGKKFNIEVEIKSMNKVPVIERHAFPARFG